MRRKVLLAMRIAAVMLLSSCGGADVPSSLPPSSVEVMEGSSPSPSVVRVAEDQYYYGVLKVQETTEKGLADYGLRWMLGSPSCGEEGCTWAWEDVTGEWTISGSLTINADGSVSGKGDGWWGFVCNGEQRMSRVELSGSATPSAIGSAPTSLSLIVVEEGASPGTCGSMRNVYEFDATGESATPSPGGETEMLTATGEIDSCRATGKAVLSIRGGELMAPWPKKGDEVDCTVRLDDPTLAGGKVEARLPNKLLAKVAQGGSVSYEVKADYVLWSGAGMWAQVEVMSTAEGDWEVTRVVST